jgi:trk system potassium uptake protein TrkA
MYVIVIGCGRMGSGLAQSLVRRGHDVVAVDREAGALANLGPAFRGRTLVGIGFDRETLIHAGIERADALAAVTSSDDANIVVARAARLIFRVPRVVARLYDPRTAEIYRRLGLQTVSTTEWGVQRIAELITYSHLDAVVSLGSDIDIVDAELPPTLAGRSVGDLCVPGEVQVVAVSRGGRSFLPNAATRLQAGDLLHLAVVAASVERLKSLLGH